MRRSLTSLCLNLLSNAIVSSKNRIHIGVINLNFERLESRNSAEKVSNVRSYLKVN